MLRIKRVYEEPAEQDGLRVLVDRLWPRGLSKEKAKVERWEKEVAPSDELRRWFGHDPARFGEFRRRYLEELRGHEALVKELARLAAHGEVTLLFAAADEEHNNAVVLREALREAGAGRK